MMNLLLAEEASKNNTGSIWIYVVLIVLVPEVVSGPVPNALV